MFLTWDKPRDEGRQISGAFTGRKQRTLDRSSHRSKLRSQGQRERRLGHTIHAPPRSSGASCRLPVQGAHTHPCCPLLPPGPHLNDPPESFCDLTTQIRPPTPTHWRHALVIYLLYSPLCCLPRLTHSTADVDYCPQPGTWSLSDFSGCGPNPVSLGFWLTAF